MEGKQHELRAERQVRVRLWRSLNAQLEVQLSWVDKGKPKGF